MTKEEIVCETEKLEKELEDIEKKKKNGWDVFQSFEFLKRKFQILEDAKKRIIKTENEKLNEKKIKAEKIKINEVNNQKIIFNTHLHPEKSIQIPIKRILSHNDKPESRIKHLNEIIDRKINLYLIFHCCVFEKENEIENFKNEIISFLKTNQSVKIAFSVFYSDSIEKTPDKKFHDFKSFSKFNTLVKCENKNELKIIRDEVIDVNSDEKALSILCNIATFRCKHRKKEIELFFNGLKDPVQDLLDYKKVMSLNFLINEKNINEEFEMLENIKCFFHETNLNMILTRKKDSIFAEALFNLKRNKINSGNEFKEFVQSLPKAYKNPKYSFKNKFFFMECMESLLYDEIFDTHFQSNKIKKDEDRYIINIEKEISISNNDHAYIANIKTDKFFSSSSVYFLDAFDFSLCYEFLEIHETAKLFVTKFNEYIGNELLLISDAKVFCGNRTNFFGITKYIARSFKTREDARIRFRIRNPIIEAFIHFCFLFSKQTTVVIDLRTLAIENQLLFTEPIVFSSFEKYGSSNLGLDGIYYFISNHKCNNHCDKFKKNLK